MTGWVVPALACLAAISSAANEPIYVFDMTGLNTLDLHDSQQAREAWDTAHLAASIQGIVNRDAPRLFLRFMPHPDDFWFEYLTSPGQWLEGRPVIRFGGVEQLVRTFAGMIRGVVVYDERVWATSNLASTIAGVEDRICLRFDNSKDSIYRRVMSIDLNQIHDAVRLINEDGSVMFTGQGTIPDTGLPSTGSAKCDAYLWARDRYLNTGRCSPQFMAFYIDAFWLSDPAVSTLSNATLTNHDFFIAQRAFFFDLHVWEEESPVDDPGQQPGTDVKTLRSLLDSMYKNAGGRIIEIGGFIPWIWKYTSEGKAGSTHGGVDSEWKYAQIISSYNGIMDADALGFSGMANASFYQHYPLKEHYPQNPRPTVDTLRERGALQEDGTVARKGYVCFYMGDYDSAAWFNYHVPQWWGDPAHGETLCTWAFNPNLDRRAPHAMDYVRTHQSPNDWFMFGDSGAGYLNPGMLVAPRDSGLPDALDAWVAHNLAYAQRYDLSITGFIIDGHAPGMGEKGMDAYLRFSPDGIVGQKIPPQGVFRDTMPFIRMKCDLYGAPEEVGARIASMAGVNLPKFLFLRTILQSPTWHKTAMDKARELNPNIEFVDPYTFFLLFKEHMRQSTLKESLPAGNPEISFTAPDKVLGLAPIQVGDGPFELAEINGRHVLRQQSPEATQYLYFEVGEEFAAPFQNDPGETARVLVELLDNAPGDVGIQFDSHLESAYQLGSVQKLNGSGDWVTLEFDLRGALFGHNQNGGGDFRLVNRKNDLCIYRVQVLRRD